MNYNIEEIPVEIFEWMNDTHFYALNSDQQKQVLRFFTPGAYDELVDAHKMCKDTSLQLQARKQKKEAMMQLFEQQYSSKHRMIISVNTLWKAACILLLLATCWFAFDPLNNHQHQSPLIATMKHDTLYRIQEKEIPVIKYDTIYVVKNANRSGSPSVNHKLQKTNDASKERITPVNEPMVASIQATGTDLQVMPISSLNNISNAFKRNSMLDDSLEKNFNFVRL